MVVLRQHAPPRHPENDLDGAVPFATFHRQNGDGGAVHGREGRGGAART